MKKVILFLILAGFVYISNGQVKGYSVESTDYFILNGDTVRATTQVDLNDTIAATEQFVLNNAGSGNGWDSITFQPSNGYAVWWYNGNRLDSTSVDDRYLKIADSTDYVTRHYMDSVVNATGTQVVYPIILPSASTVAGRITGAI
ncbi:MAG: hypothetical protein ACOCUV_00890, partial [bacterium]